MIGALGQIGWRFGLMCFDVIEGILGDVILALGREVIEDLAKMERKWTESVEVTAWRIFQRLAKEHLSEPAIENGIQEAMVKVAEDLMTGRGGR